MVQKSKYVALKNYVPMGLPSEYDFVIKNFANIFSTKQFEFTFLVELKPRVYFPQPSFVFPFDGFLGIGIIQQQCFPECNGLMPR